MGELNGGGVATIDCIINMLGLSYLWNEFGYNPTWWFISLIVLLYAVFPLVYKSTNKFPEITIALSCYLFFFPMQYHCLALICDWLLPFATGIFFAQNDLFAKIKNSKCLNKKISIFIMIILLMILRVKFLKHSVAGASLWLDTPLSLLMIILSYLYCKPETKLYRSLSFIGIHSTNIFLMHTFIFSIYLSKFSYALRYPPLILVQLLIVCLAFSVILEKTKSSLKKYFTTTYSYLNKEKIRI